MFSERDRSITLDMTLTLVQGDPRIEAAVVTGSLGAGRADRWSDIDLDLVVGDAHPCESVAAAWVKRLYDEFPVVHHYETAFGSTLVRGLFLDNGLLLDLAFTPSADFAVWAPVRVVYDRVGGVTRSAANPASSSVTPDRAGEAAFAWHDILHARTAMERGRRWQALYFVQRVRNRTLTLAAARHGLDANEFKDVDELPAAATSGLQDSLIDDLEPAKLRTALEAAARAFLAELRQGDSDLADRIAEYVTDLARRPD
jgi:hypothetical protein